MAHFSFTEENYIKGIYLLSADGQAASTNSIAKNLNTKPASVTDMLKKLSEKKVLDYKKYNGAQLTALGDKIALKTIRKHRLWECFLVDKLHFGWDEVHDVAEQLEHIQSEKLSDSLDAFLGFPSYDPHGDPIPNKEGVFPPMNSQTLDHFGVGSKLKIKAVKDSSTSFLRYLEKQNIDLETSIEILEIESFDQSMLLKINGKTTSLSAQVCENLFVQ